MRNVSTQPSPTQTARFPKFAVCDWVRVYNTEATTCQASATDASRPSSPSTGRTPTNSSQFAPVPPLTSRTALPCALSSYVWIHPRTVRARMIAGVLHYYVSRPVPTPKTMATSLVFSGWGGEISAPPFFQEPPPVPRNSRRRLTSLQRLQVEKITWH